MSHLSAGSSSASGGSDSPSQSTRSTTMLMTNNPDLDEMFTIRVLTLNCWGLWLGAKKRRQRMAGIIRYLLKNSCDIVFLQEVWVTSDFEVIREETKHVYRFAHLFRSGSVLGSSGIVILCKWLPRVVHFEPYSLNGSPFYPWHGDWFAGKGIAYSRVDFDGLSLHLFSTHTHAYYKENETIRDQYSVHRVCQSYQLARFINFISDTACIRKTNGKDLLIVAGDMNSTSSELPYRILTTMGNLTDCFKTSRNSYSSSNIVHRHKQMNYRQKLCIADNGSMSSGSNGSQIENSSSVHSKFGDNYQLDSYGLGKSYDSDTEDEDVTYCHPRNSFTPGCSEYKAFKFNSTAPNQPCKSDSSSDINIQEKEEDKQKTIGENGGKAFERTNGAQNLRSPRSKDLRMKRIDFILCRLLTHGHCVIDRVATEGQDQSLDCSLSDHEPVMVELMITDLSHDLMDRNHISNPPSKSPEHGRSLASVVEPKVAINGVNHVQETTDKWVPEEVPINESVRECSRQVMDETQKILMEYYLSNRASKTQLFYVALLIFVITLPTSTYYALNNDLMPISTIVFIWFAASFIFAVGLLIGFLSYRFEQGAIEAIINDITCKMSVSKDHNYYENKWRV